ncbi:protein of unknown function [Paraburkholderia dioscoreae]|uniref:Uncharacterized protein n=1 Tax=Paraburkholderia dioscoreae TaxID=2604047 RepID=A0A5Q4Z5Y8_9BURK|nr:protein of unknown function [Paraburkholderia dioscoreae]
MGSRPRFVRTNSSTPNMDSISRSALLAPGWDIETAFAAFSSEPWSASAASRRSCFACRRPTMELRDGIIRVAFQLYHYPEVSISGSAKHFYTAAMNAAVYTIDATQGPVGGPVKVSSVWLRVHWCRKT